MGDQDHRKLVINTKITFTRDLVNKSEASMFFSLVFRIKSTKEQQCIYKCQVLTSFSLVFQLGICKLVSTEIVQRLERIPCMHRDP